jgi:N-acetylneuraminic acid mutarotase
VSIPEAIDYYPDLPTVLSSFGAVVVGDFLYVYGGHAGEAHHYSTETTLGQFRRLNLRERAYWEELPGGPKLQGLSLVTHQGKLYRVGGMQPRNAKTEKTDARSQAACAVYDPATSAWADVEPLPEPRSSHDAAVSGDFVYVFGGWHLHGAAGKPTWHKAGLRRDLSKPNAQWEAIDQPFHRRALTVASVGTRVFVIGGMNEANKVERTVNVFDSRSGMWSEGPPLPVQESHGFTPASAAIDGKLYVAPADGKLYVLSDVGDAWIEVGLFKEPRFSARMVATPSRQLLILGGADPNSLLSSVEAVAPV